MKPVILPFGKTIYQTDSGQSITSDTALAVEKIIEQIPDKQMSVLELGSGNGIISIMLAHYCTNLKITAIEIQPKLVELSRSNAKLAEVEAKFIEADLKEFKSSEKFDLIISNPPYFSLNSGKISPIKERALSRHELKCNMLDVLSCVKRNMKNRAFLLYPAARMEDLKKNVKKVDLKLAAKFILNADFSGNAETLKLKEKSKILAEIRTVEI